MGVNASQEFEDHANIEQRFEAGFQSNGPLRILCLHGHGSNSDITRLQIENICLSDRHGLTCDYFQGGYEIETNYPILKEFSQNPFRSWINSRDSISESFEKSLKELFYILTHHGPYDGIFGFSLGGLMATCLSNPIIWKHKFNLDILPFKFIICACAGGSANAKSFQLRKTNNENDDNLISPFENIQGNKIQAPSFHIIGTLDGGKNDSERILSWYDGASSHEIHCGHELPLPLVKDEPLHTSLAQFLVTQGNVTS